MRNLKGHLQRKTITSHVTTDYCNLHINNFRYSKPIIARQSEESCIVLIVMVNVPNTFYKRYKRYLISN